MILGRYRVRLRQRARFWRGSLSKLFPPRTEHELFGTWVRHVDRRFLDGQQVARLLDRKGRERAALLLAANLSSSQRRRLRYHGFFIVTGKSGRRFRIWARRHLAVELIGPSPHHKPWLYCVNNDFSDADAVLPLADYMLELKLCLEADEHYFLRTSNPTFEQGRIEKNELIRRARDEDHPPADRLAVEWLATANRLSSE